jgi:murein DD-endopeptidase MepM/ murein hydrolase activator NlpD
LERLDGLSVWRPSALQDGQLFLLELEGADCAAPGIEWLSHHFEAFAAASRWQVLLPVPLDITPGEQALVVRCGKRHWQLKLPVTAGVYPESKLTVDPKFVGKAPARAKLEQEAMTRAFGRGTNVRLWSAVFQRPTPGVETSLYGGRRTFNGKVQSRHRGLDLDGKTGVPVVATNDGVVVLVGKDYYYVGNAVFVDHGAELFTVYYHMSSVDVHEGQRVSAGERIGAVGATGRVTGPHLHFGVKLAGIYVNPLDLLLVQPGQPLMQASASK